MDDFLLYSIVGSIVVTIALNIIPILFPNGAAKIQRKLKEHARKSIEQHEDDGRPSVKVFFPWKAMLIGSVVLTLLVNLVAWLSQG